MVRTLIIDDHASMQESLSFALEGTGKFSLVASLTNADYAQVYYERLLPDLVFMDVCTNGEVSGIDAAQAICQANPQAKVIVMSGFDEISYASRAKKAGAKAFVCKSESLDTFVEVAERVIAGEEHFPETKPIKLPTGESPLTEREIEVLRLLCQHLTSKQIAEQLFISESTVKYHKANMLNKTGFTKTMDLAFYMISNGWINPRF